MTNIVPMRDTAPATDPSHVSILAKAVANWFVRRDGKYYDVDRLNVAISKTDVKQICISRFQHEYPDIPLTSDLAKTVFSRVLEKTHADPEQIVSVWSGQRVCRPGDPNRIIHERGSASVNTWTLPGYRALDVTEADYGAAAEFFEWVFPRETERSMVLDWLAWNLQHENDKPGWAPFLYSRSKGSGKSTFCQLVATLFGVENCVTQNNVDKLTSKFNMTVLQSKLVVSEELQLRPDSTQSNTLKTYITERTTLSELKGHEAERVDQRCCFIFTTNHLPIWIEADDRRYYVVEVDHDGHASGPRSRQFQAVVEEVLAQIDDPEQLAGLYHALMIRVIPETFSAKSLNIEDDGTEVMKRIQGASRQVTLEQLEEFLNDKEINALPEAEVAAFVRDNLRANINSTRHMMSELGWTKQKVKWDGVDHARAIWVRPDYVVERGKLIGPDGSRVRISDHLDDREMDITL